MNTIKRELYNAIMIYKRSPNGLKWVLFYFLQGFRMSIFWTRDMKRKQNVSETARWFARKIMAVQNSRLFKV